MNNHLKMIWRILILIIVISSIENRIDGLLETTAQFDLELLEFYNNELDEYVWTKLKDLHQRKQNALRHLPRNATDTARYDKMAAIFDKFLIVNSKMEAYYQKTKEQFMIKWKKNLTQASKINENHINARDSQRLTDDMKHLTTKFSQEYIKCLTNIFYKK